VKAVKAALSEVVQVCLLVVPCLLVVAGLSIVVFDSQERNTPIYNIGFKLRGV